MYIKYNLVTAAIVLTLGASNFASAAISPEEADRLGKDLTPVGAEKAANADGSIPEWDGGLTEMFPGWTPGADRPRSIFGRAAIVYYFR